jgi:Patatin-like phospholipase
VALPGTDWVARFRHVLERAESEVIDAASDTNAFAQANARIVEAAHELDERPKAIIVWNGQEGDGPSGTRDFIGRLGFSGPNERARVIDPTPRAYERRETPGPAKKLLALDGGGIRGALSLEILAALESQLRARYGSQLVLADYFDYIGGTSTAQSSPQRWLWESPSTRSGPATKRSDRACSSGALCRCERARSTGMVR